MIFKIAVELQLFLMYNVKIEYKKQRGVIMEENKGKNFELLSKKLEQATNDFLDSLSKKKQVLIHKMELEKERMYLEKELQMLKKELHDIEQNIEEKEANLEDASFEKEKIGFRKTHINHIQEKLISIKCKILDLHKMSEHLESLEDFYKECKMKNLDFCCDVFSKLSLDTPIEAFKPLATLDKIVDAKKQVDEVFDKMTKGLKTIKEEGQNLVQKIKLKKEEGKEKIQQNLDDIKENAVVIEAQLKAKNLKERMLKGEDISNEEIKEAIDLWVKGIEFLLKRQA